MTRLASKYKDMRIISRRRAEQRGQTIVVALLVLLLLAFAAALFVTIIARNLQNSGHQTRLEVSNSYAEAGQRFADDQLTHSTDGADWRPPLQFALSTQPTNQQEKDRYVLVPLTAADTRDPDKEYLDQGFSRYNFGQGRFLIRVTYDPMTLDPATAPANANANSSLGRYIKIESVGREGNIDVTDPTTFTTAPKIRLNSTMVAYKAIGITDYARFVTNPDKRSDVWNLGVPSVYNNGKTRIETPGAYDFTGTTGPTGLELPQYPIITQYGASDAYLLNATKSLLIPNPAVNAGAPAPPGWSFVPGGGSIHVNGSARFFGQNELYLNDPTVLSSTLQNLAPAYSDRWEIAGSMFQDNYNPAQPLYLATPTSGAQAAVLVLNSLDSSAAPTVSSVTPSNYVIPTTTTPAFDSQGGLVRDGFNGNDVKGQPRNINRLEPPDITVLNPATNLPRYKDITINSAPRQNPSSAANSTSAPLASYKADTGQYGYGQAIYIDNTSDVQKESADVNGGYTLVDDWLNRVAPASSTSNLYGWKGNIYTPPAVNISIGRQIATIKYGSGAPTTATFYGIRIERSDKSFKDDSGNPITGTANDGTTSSVMTINYDNLGAVGDNGASNDPAASPAVANQANPNNDVVIYAEGNIRVSGNVSEDPNVAAPTSANSKLPRHVTLVTNATAYIDGNLLKGRPDSSITILARDYVCVNTTQFFVGVDLNNTVSGLNVYSGTMGVDHALEFPTTSAASLIQQFTFGLPSTSFFTPAIVGNPLTRYYPGQPAAATGKLALYLSAGPGGGGPASGTYQFADSTGVIIASVLPPLFNSLTRTTYDVSVLQNQVEGQSITLTTSGTGSDNLVEERAAVLPMDVRIEAVLFAQNKSFFVIPGEWFNSDKQDDMYKYATTTTGYTRPNRDNTLAADARFPFYGQPVDLRLTISGSVAEGYPAPISAQSAWMQKWGWIPHYHGSLLGTAGVGGGVKETNGHAAGVPSAPPDVGFAIVYDPLAAYPYIVDPTNTKPNQYIRLDTFGRPLPFAPKLPVSTGLIYSGQSGQQPIFQ